LATLLLLNGPNLGLLGNREPEIYGRTTLAQIVAGCRELAASLGHQLLDFQSDAEHELIGRVQDAADEGVAFIVANPAGLTHTSVALRDAFAAVRIPFIEVHISNPHAREPFRRTSYFSDLAVAVISGCGTQGYEFALRAAAARLEAGGR
jgi:3-dehydroquinate dehydratase-2